MTTINIEDIDKLKFLVEMKKNSPEEYQQFFKDMKDILIDFIKFAKEINEVIE